MLHTIHWTCLLRWALAAAVKFEYESTRPKFNSFSSTTSVTMAMSRNTKAMVKQTTQLPLLWRYGWWRLIVDCVTIQHCYAIKVASLLFVHVIILKILIFIYIPLRKLRNSIYIQFNSLYTLNIQHSVMDRWEVGKSIICILITMIMINKPKCLRYCK